MKRTIRLLFLALTFLPTSATLAQADGARRDSQAIEVLQGMSDYLAGLDRFAVYGHGSADARLDAGLIVSNQFEVKLRVQRPASLHISRFDGERTQHLYVHKGELTHYDTVDQFYATAEVPDGIEAAMKFGLERLNLEAPLMDLLYQDVFTHLAGTTDPVLYLSGKSRVGNKDCHHIAIRNPEVDIQIWVEEGARPLPRQLVLTSKWKGGAPRFVAQLEWDTKPEFANGEFEFIVPEGASRIDFIREPAEAGRGARKP